MNERMRVGCDRLDGDVAVRYVSGDLDEREQARFEDHYFECAACLATVQALQAGMRVLPGRRSVSASAVRRIRAPAWAMAAGVAALAVSALVTLRSTRMAAPPPSSYAGATPSPAVDPYAELAWVEPPPYVPLVMRGRKPANDPLAAAMQKYTSRDFAAAAAGLREAIAAGSATDEARFYLGVSELLAGRADVAAEELRSVAAAASEPALATEARFYRSKALLAQRRVAEARAELQMLAVARGHRAQEASDLLRRVDAARDRSR